MKKTPSRPRRRRVRRSNYPKPVGSRRIQPKDVVYAHQAQHSQGKTRKSREGGRQITQASHFPQKSGRHIFTSDFGVHGQRQVLRVSRATCIDGCKGGSANKLTDFRHETQEQATQTGKETNWMEQANRCSARGHSR